MEKPLSYQLSIRQFVIAISQKLDNNYQNSTPVRKVFPELSAVKSSSRSELCELEAFTG